MLTDKLYKKIQPMVELYTKNFIDYESQSLIGLYEGRAGTLFLQYLIYSYNKTAVIKSELISNINFLIEELEKKEILHPELSSGLAGIGYVFDIINMDKDLNIDLSEFLLEVDEALIDAVQNFIDVENYDILHGLLGLGLYFLRRGDYDMVKIIIQVLDDSSIKENDFITWTRHDDLINENIYDFGLAHGISGIIYFLGKCFKNGIQKRQCKRLIDGSIYFLEKNEQDFKKTGSLYPSKYVCSKYNFKPKEEQFSRFAWCYGDLGVLNSMLSVSEWTNNSKLRNKCIEKLIVISNRKSFEETLIEDSGFCHGTSGISLIYKNCYDITKNKELFKTSLFWLNQTFKLECHDFKKSSCGHLFVLEKGKMTTDINLLAGLGGVLVLYLSFVNPKEDKWKELFFLN